MTVSTLKALFCFGIGGWAMPTNTLFIVSEAFLRTFLSSGVEKENKSVPFLTLLPEHRLSYHGDKSLSNHIYIRGKSKGGGLCVNQQLINQFCR